jgi:hypothetical protein
MPAPLSAYSIGPAVVVAICAPRLTSARARLDLVVVGHENQDARGEHGNRRDQQERCSSAHGKPLAYDLRGRLK